MPRPVYSTNFLAPNVQTTGIPSYTVPSGYVASLRGATIYKSVAATATSVYMAITDPTGTFNTIVWIANLTSVTAVQSEVWNGMVVAPAGAKIIFGRLSAAGSWYCTASGFLLSVI